jgi:tetratricopeptide (TPR) repeat protein
VSKIDEVIELLRSGRLIEAKSILEDFLNSDSTNIDALYNLGMCFTELGQPNEAIPILIRCIELKPEFSNAYVALGFAFEKTKDTENAKKYFLEAVKIDPINSYALRNLGGLCGKLGDLEKSIYYLEKSYRINPSDPITVYGIGHIYKTVQDYEKADEFFRKVLALDVPDSIKSLAKDGLREIAVNNLKSKGFRIDAIFYFLAALQLFSNKQNKEVQDISFEIALRGREGFDINDPQKKYRIKLLEGEFSGLQLVCYMYAGFNRIDPTLDVGVDLSKEYQFAVKLFMSEDVH